MSMQPKSAAEPRASNVLYIAAFMSAFIILEMLYQGCRGTRLEHILIDQMTVVPSAELISWITPQEGIAAEGHSLVSRHIRLSVLNGCEGTEAILMLIAAILIFPRNGRSKLLGMLGGGLLIYAVNQVRIVALYYCLRFDRPLFDMLHGYIAPIIVIAVAGLYFMYWMSDAKPKQIA